MKIVLENLTKKFPGRDKKRKDEVIAVNNFNFEIPDGKLIGLLGPSGCGKSTALNLLCGLLTPTEGKIYFGDDEVTNLPAEKRGVGFVFQNYALYPHLTVMQNITFPLENLKGKDKMSKEQMQKKSNGSGQTGTDRPIDGSKTKPAFRWAATASSHCPCFGKNAASPFDG